jgi:hypothetical protein
MATITPTIERSGDGSILYYTYETLTTTNADGAPIPFAEWADRSVQAVGTWGTGGTLKWQGSNDGATWVDLTDPQGNAISKGANFIEGVLEITRYARPLISAGDGSTDIDVFVVCRRQNPMRT